LGFYEIFPKNEVPIEEYTPEGKKVVVKQNYSYALQAGSFRNPADADRLRAKLILMGLQVIIQPVEQQDSVWHRVLVGPIDTRLELDRTRNRLAQANIVSIQLRMSQ
jgi:cell division protein FtsN